GRRALAPDRRTARASTARTCVHNRVEQIDDVLLGPLVRAIKITALEQTLHKRGPDLLIRQRRARRAEVGLVVTIVLSSRTVAGAYAVGPARLLERRGG